MNFYNKIAYISFFLIVLPLIGFDGKTEECPLLPAAYVEIYDQVAQAKELIMLEISKLSHAHDPEQIKRSAKLLLLTKQSEIFNNLNNQYASGNMDQEVYEGLYEYIFDSFGRLSGHLLRSGTVHEIV